MPDLATLPTPCLLLDEPRMAANIARIHGRLAGTGVAYRAHLKTAKSVEVARRLMTGPLGPAMVWTLKEAGIFAAAGVTDLTYGVGIAPDKLDRLGRLQVCAVGDAGSGEPAADAGDVRGHPRLVEQEAGRREGGEFGHGTDATAGRAAAQ